MHGLQKARDVKKDLVEISPNADPPVCRIMDHGKHLFEKKKRQSQAKKKQKQVQLKEVKLTPRTEEADYQVKLSRILKFLEAGDKVKVSVRFKGREIAHNTFGLEVLNRVKNDMGEDVAVELEPKLEGRQMFMILVTKK